LVVVQVVETGREFVEELADGLPLFGGRSPDRVGDERIGGSHPHLVVELDHDLAQSRAQRLERRLQLLADCLVVLLRRVRHALGRDGGDRRRPVRGGEQSGSAQEHGQRARDV
jgi:hypothetical protein